jgi:hypothetical protein
MCNSRHYVSPRTSNPTVPTAESCTMPFGSVVEGEIGKGRVAGGRYAFWPVCD